MALIPLLGEPDMVKINSICKKKFTFYSDLFWSSYVNISTCI